jgi:alginate O-acetyltransferase complex protein AlgI
LNFIIWGAIHGIGLIINHLWTNIINSNQFEKNSTPQNSTVSTTLDDRLSQDSNLINWLSYSLNKHLALYTSIFSWIYTFTFVSICWIFFNTSSFEIAIKYLQRLIDLSSNSQASQLKSWQLYAVIFIVLIMNFAGDKVSHLCEITLAKKNLMQQTIFTSIALYVVFRLGPSTVAPFIYFNF